jgi:DNA-directed RNA polymerase subunit RPC12/RpoP
MAITELKILKYECEKCLHDWMMINPGKDSRNLEDNGYFCPYCGEKKGETNELPRFATDKEAGFSTEATRMPMSAPIIVQKGEKTGRILQAEDRITQARCTDGGWWNPITKQCQGEGVGHNVKELDNDRDL